MVKSLHPIALPPLLAAEFLDYISQHHHSPTTLIICSTREAFLQQLQISIIHQTPTQVSTTDSAPSTPLHLLHPTIHRIAISRTIALAFTPTVPHLRAYLATYSPRVQVYPSTASPSIHMPSQKPLLAIWGLASLHRSTTEYSAQGLSRTLAVAVEAAHSAGQRLVLAESRQDLDEPEGEEGREVLLGPWREQVSLLSGSVRFGGEESGLNGRMMEVGDVVRRWCRFLKVDEL